MGGHPRYGPGPWGVLGPGGVNIDRESPAEVGRQEVRIHLSGGGKGGGGIRGDVGVNLEKA